MAQICTSCGYEGKGRKQLRGSKAAEIFIWAVLMIPGPLYSAWRRIKVPVKCPNCGHFTMASLHSNAGRLMQQKIDVELGVLKPKAKPLEEPLPQVAAAMPAQPKTPVALDQW